MQGKSAFLRTMVSLLIISDDTKKAGEYTTTFLSQEGVHPLDITSITPETSLGVEDVRNLQKNIYLAPFKSNIKAVVIYDAEKITTEGQNALLKMLEEPPDNTQIILVATTNQYFLPTILSRCKTVFLDNANVILTDDDKQQFQKDYTQLISSGIGNKLKFAQDLSSDKTAALLWIKQGIYVLRDEMLSEIENAPMKHIQLLHSFQNAYENIQTTNINPRMVLENLFFQL